MNDQRYNRSGDDRIFSNHMLFTPLNSTTMTNATSKDYDHTGAAMYAAGVLIYYSIGVVLMLFFHVRPQRFQNQSSFFDHEDTDRSTTGTANPFAHYDRVRTNDTQKQILNELKDPERRERLWKIYYSSREKQKEPHPQYYQTIATESVVIGRINRKLATIHQMTIDDDNDVISTVNMTTKFLPKSFSSMRRFGSGQTKPHPRLQSESDIPTAESKMISINGQMRKSFNRFTIEKVPDNDTNTERKA